MQRGSSRPIAGIGRVVLWSGGSLWIGQAAGRVQSHAHHAIQIALALSGSVRFRVQEHSRWIEYSAALVLPHERHQFDGNDQTVAQLFVEPETAQGRALLERYSGEPVAALAGHALEAFKDSLGRMFTTRANDEALIAAGQQAVASLSGGAPALSVDARITSAIAWISSRLHGSISLAEAARVAHLSPGRFRHLFVAQTGISFRAYVLWARVRQAVDAAMHGMSWVDAAQACGFADSAHLSRTCRRIFGIAPSSLIREP
jgi:AraC-like DNA-binding protein